MVTKHRTWSMHFKNKIHTTVYLQSLSKYCVTAFTDLSKYNYTLRFDFDSFQNEHVPYHFIHINYLLWIIYVWRIQSTIKCIQHKLRSIPKFTVIRLKHISPQISNTKESLLAQTGAPFLQLLCNRDPDTHSDRFSLFLILQPLNIISTIRSNNHHQRFTQQTPPPSQTLLATNHKRSAICGYNLPHQSRRATHIFAKHSIGCDVIRHDRQQLSSTTS